MKVRTKKRPSRSPSDTAGRALSPSRLDPTRTSGLRRAFVAQLRRQFDALRVAILRHVGDGDAFGLEERPSLVGNTARDRMPQVRKADWEEFLTFARARTTVTREDGVDPDTLKAVQHEFSQERVDAIPMEKLQYPILVSRDGYVLDGNHRWIKAHQTKTTIPVLRLGLDKTVALAMVRSFPKAEYVENTLVANVIRKLPDGKYRLYSHSGDNLGTFDSEEAAKEHEREVEYFKHVNNIFCPTGEGGGIDPTCTEAGLKSADTDWEDYGFASTVKTLSAGGTLGTHDINGNLITPKTLSEAKSAVKHLQAAAEVSRLESSTGVWRGEFQEAGTDVNKKYALGSSVEFNSLTAVATERSFAEKYLDPQFAGFQDDKDWLKGFGGKGNDIPVKVLFDFGGAVTGYRLKHTGLPEGLLPKGAKYTVSGVEKLGQHSYRVSLSDKQLSKTIPESSKTTTSQQPERLQRDSSGKITGVWSRRQQVYLPYSGTQKKIGGKWITSNAEEYRFQSDPEKVKAFQTWLEQQYASVLVNATAEQIWTRFVEEGFKRGAGRAFDDVSQQRRAVKRAERGIPAELDFTRETREEFLRSSFGQPVAVDKVKLLAGRSFDELKDVTREMSNKISRVLVDGLVTGKGARQVASDMVKQVGLGQKRALLISRTELVRAHAQGQLMSMERLGVTHLGVAVEYTTSGYAKCAGLSAKEKKRIPCVCSLCEVLQGIVVTLEEANGLIPRHPGCLCSWRPAVLVKEDQIRGQREVARAVATSIYRGASQKVKEKRGWEDDYSGWAAETKISKDRPKGITINAESLNGSLERFSELVANVFCPTGEGGGVDPSCPAHGDVSEVFHVKDPLTPSEKATVIGYSENRHFGINGRLRGVRGLSESPEVNKSIEEIDSAIAKSIVKVPLVVHRGIFNKSMMSVKVGSVLEDAAYMSTSLDRGNLDKFNKKKLTSLEINIPKGFHALHVDSLVSQERIELSKQQGGGPGTEREVLLPRGTKLKVTDVSSSSDGGKERTLIKAEVISETTH